MLNGLKIQLYSSNFVSVYFKTKMKYPDNNVQKIPTFMEQITFVGRQDDQSLVNLLWEHGQSLLKIHTVPIPDRRPVDQSTFLPFSNLKARGRHRGGETSLVIFFKLGSSLCFQSPLMLPNHSQTVRCNPPHPKMCAEKNIFYIIKKSVTSNKLL